MNKTFEDWLIISDVDGTLNNKARRLPRRNYVAIEKFVAAGGHFTLASGRPVCSMERKYHSVPCNAPAIVLNGAGIYDFDKNEMINRYPIGEAGRMFVAEAIKRFPTIEAGVFFDDYVYLIQSGVLSKGQLFFEKVRYAKYEITDIPPERWCKVVFWGNPALITRLADFTKQRLQNKTLNFMRTSPVSLEMVDGTVHKGVAVMKLAQQLGIDKSHVAAIGDYYNDWEMLKTVGLPACAGQAPKDIHAICKFEACHCNNGCVADLIEYIMGMEVLGGIAAK